MSFIRQLYEYWSFRETCMHVATIDVKKRFFTFVILVTFFYVFNVFYVVSVFYF